MKSDPLDVDFRVCWRPLHRFPPRSMCGCQQPFCSSCSSPSRSPAAAAGDLARTTVRPRQGRLHGLEGMDPVRPCHRRLWRAGQRLHQPSRHDRAQRAALEPRRRILGRLRAGRSGTGNFRQALVGRLRHLGDVQSGYSASQFPRDGRHGSYLSALYDRERASRSAPFLLHAPSEYSPKPGDLVCSGSAGRSGATPIRAPHTAASTTRRLIATSSPTCAALTCHAIGGNVKDSVAMSLFPVDSRGRLMIVSGRPGFWSSRSGG